MCGGSMVLSLQQTTIRPPHNPPRLCLGHLLRQISLGDALLFEEFHVVMQQGLQVVGRSLWNRLSQLSLQSVEQNVPAQGIARQYGDWVGPGSDAIHCRIHITFRHDVGERQQAPTVVRRRQLPGDNRTGIDLLEIGMFEESWCLQAKNTVDNTGAVAMMGHVLPALSQVDLRPCAHPLIDGGFGCDRVPHRVDRSREAAFVAKGDAVGGLLDGAVRAESHGSIVVPKRNEREWPDEPKSVNRRGRAQVRVSTRLRKYAEAATTRHVHSAETVTTSAALAAETDEASKEVLSPQTRDGPS